MPKIEHETGVYVCRILEQGLSEATTGTPQFWLRFEVLGKPDPANPDNYLAASVKRERTMFRAITEKTIDMLTEDLEQLGFQGTSFRDLQPGTPNHYSFVGQDIDMYCKHETYNGAPHEKWQLSRPGGGMDLKELEPTKLRQLDALFGKALKGIAKPAGAAAARPASNGTAAAAVSDDDIY